MSVEKGTTEVQNGGKNTTTECIHNHQTSADPARTANRPKITATCQKGGSYRKNVDVERSRHSTKTNDLCNFVLNLDTLEAEKTEVENSHAKARSQNGLDVHNLAVLQEEVVVHHSLVVEREDVAKLTI
jgi:hypothetical protein